MRRCAGAVCHSACAGRMGGYPIAISKPFIIKSFIMVLAIRGLEYRAAVSLLRHKQTAFPETDALKSLIRAVLF